MAAIAASSSSSTSIFSGNYRNFSNVSYTNISNSQYSSDTILVNVIIATSSSIATSMFPD